MSVVLALLLLSTPADSSLATRNIHQQMLALELANARKEAGTLDPKRAVEFVEALAEEWAARTEDQSATYRRLNTYAPMWAVYQVIDSVSTADKCEVWERFAVPAFIADVDDIASEPPSEALAPLFRISNLDWAAALSDQCDLPAPLREQLASAFDEYVHQLEAYEDTGWIPSEYHARLRRFAAGSVQRVAFEALLRDRQTDAAFAELAARLGAGILQDQAVGYAAQIADQYVEQNQLAHALAVYDLLGTSLSEDTFATSELEAAYARLDSASSRARTRRVRPDTQSELHASGVRADWSGAFTNVMTSEPFDLRSLEGKRVLLDVWSIGCGPCIEHIPTLNRLSDEYADRLTVVSLNNDIVYDTPLEHVEAAVKQHGLATLVLSDSAEGVLTERFEVTGWPLYLLISPDGQILEARREGRRSLSLDEIERYVAALPNP